MLQNQLLDLLPDKQLPKDAVWVMQGAIIGGKDDTAAAKMKIMAECGIYVVQSPADIGKTMVTALKR